METMGLKLYPDHMAVQFERDRKACEQRMDVLRHAQRPGMTGWLVASCEVVIESI